MDAIKLLKTAVNSDDPILAGKAVDALREKGFTYRDCFRVALAAKPEYQIADFDDLMARADDIDSGRKD